MNPKVKFVDSEKVKYYAVALEDFHGSYPCPAIHKGDITETDLEHVAETMETGEHSFNYEEMNHWCLAMVKSKIVKETITTKYETVFDPDEIEPEEIIE